MKMFFQSNRERENSLSIPNKHLIWPSQHLAFDQKPPTRLTLIMYRKNDVHQQKHSICIYIDCEKKTYVAKIEYVQELLGLSLGCRFYLTNMRKDQQRCSWTYCQDAHLILGEQELQRRSTICVRYSLRTDKRQ